MCEQHHLTKVVVTLHPRGFSDERRGVHAGHVAAERGGSGDETLRQPANAPAAASSVVLLVEPPACDELLMWSLFAPVKQASKPPLVGKPQALLPLPNAPSCTPSLVQRLSHSAPSSRP